MPRKRQHTPLRVLLNNRLVGHLIRELEQWAGLDSNQRRRKPVDLQSTPFGHSGTYPITDWLSPAVPGVAAKAHPEYRERSVVRHGAGNCNGFFACRLAARKGLSD